ncbi:MAG: hypothetical protein KJ063_05990 [Anaerolineae bacterium]|nr:hypothetical protein [Anaerolineae bacterium]
MKHLLRLTITCLILSLPFLLVSYHMRSSVASPPALALEINQLPVVGFANASYSVLENAGFITLNVTLNITSTSEVRVNYATQNGTAVAGTDYQATNGTLIFVPGDNSEPVVVTIFNNSTYQGSRNFQVVLSNPVNATIGNGTATVTIIDDEQPPTVTPTPTVLVTPVFVDMYEPNNSLSTAYNTSAGVSLCGASLWPVGDYDYFRFFVKGGFTYQILTRDLSVGLDSYLTLYNSQGHIIAENDDDPTNTSHPKASRIQHTPHQDGFLYASVHNLDPTDPAGKTYCFETRETIPTPGPTHTPVSGQADSCEYNGDFDSACLMGVNQEKTNMNFVPLFGEGPDNDYYRLWILSGVTYTCLTDDLSPFTDTNMILYDHNRNLIAGNNDRALGDPRSEVIYYAPYTGWLYILVGSVVPVDYALAHLYTYSVGCQATVATLTPTPSNTPVRPPTGGGGIPSTAVPSPTPIVFPTFPPSPTPFTLPAPATETPRPIVQFVPLPTATAAAGGQGQTVTLDVTLYYDGNNNYTPELTEGIMGAAVAVYDGSTGALLAFGYTNEAGAIRFSQLTATGPVRVTVPFFSFSQVVSTGSGLLTIRIAPSSLPIGIP